MMAAKSPRYRFAMDQSPAQPAPVAAAALPAPSLIDLAAERVGGRALVANDEFFAPKENLLKPGRGVFIDEKYTDHGKWMDGWETRRRREPGFDWVIIQLGLPGVIQAITVDTNHFRGNHPAACAVDGAALSGEPSAEQCTNPQVRWTEIVPQSALQGHAENNFVVNHNEHRFTHVLLRIFPDGGVARLRVFGEVVPDWDAILKPGGPVDLIAIEHGGSIIGCSDMFFSHPQNLLMPGRAATMGDGWETKRRRGPGHDWVIVKLGRRGILKSFEVDTNHFKGNFPESCSVDGCDAHQIPFAQVRDKPAMWTHILPRSKLQPDTQNIFAKELRGRNITVNAVAPGPIATELFLKGKTEQQVTEAGKWAPLERLGQPEDIAKVVAFLAGPDGGWVNGQTLRANGGMV